MITPFFDFTRGSAGVPPPNGGVATAGMMGGMMGGGMSGSMGGTMGGGMSGAAPPLEGGSVSAAERRVLNSGKGSSKRSVSETKKKYVAAHQGWKCGDCQRQLPAWFEVDHVIALEHGGSNHVDNLVALCRDCHGKKTAMSFL